MLVEPCHGYAVMQKVAEIRQGAVEVGPGTFYGAFSNSEKEGLIEKVRKVDRRRTYALTAKGEAILRGTQECWHPPGKLKRSLSTFRQPTSPLQLTRLPAFE